MNKPQLDFICNMFGDTSLPENDRWKCIKHIFIENPIVDVQLLLKKNEISFTDDSIIGPGFYILDAFNAEFGIHDSKERNITFIPLTIIDKVSIVTNNIKTEDVVM